MTASQAAPAANKTANKRAKSTDEVSQASDVRKALQGRVSWTSVLRSGHNRQPTRRAKNGPLRVHLDRLRRIMLWGPLDVGTGQPRKATVMDIREARARRTSPRITLVAALATIATLVGSGIATVSDDSLSAARRWAMAYRRSWGRSSRGAKRMRPLLEHGSRTRRWLRRPPRASRRSTYRRPTCRSRSRPPRSRRRPRSPRSTPCSAPRPASARPPSRCSVALDRAQAADSAGAGLWFVRQANASAEYALSASSLLARFPALQAAMVRAFVADRMSVTLTPAQFAAAKAKLLRHLPASLPQLLGVAAAPYQPTTVPEVAALKAAILDTAAFKNVVAHLAPRALRLPSAFASSSVSASEIRIVAELKQYADSILQPVSASALPKMAGRFEPFAECGGGEEEFGEALHVLDDSFEAISDAFENFGGEAGEAAPAGR